MKVLSRGEEKTTTGQCLKCGAWLEITASDVKYPIHWLFDRRCFVICAACGTRLIVSDDDLEYYFGMTRK